VTGGRLAPPAVVVGIDRSRAATAAVVWAIDEAASRDVPLRLIAVAEPDAAEETGDRLAEAELALREAVAAAEAATTGRDGSPVRIETEVVTGSPTQTLLDASRTASMVCVGAVGVRYSEHHRVGSTASALVASARCPVAVIRRRQLPPPEQPGWVVVELDETPDSAAVLQFGVAEARLRSAPLRVLGAWRSRYTDVHDSHAVSDGNRMVRAQLDRRLSEWKRRYPDLDVRPVAVHGSVLNFLARNAADIQLVVVGARNTSAVAELLGPSGLAALRNTECSVLVVDPQRLL
jgi:nucleotide-binding universal stress UspA family protein